MCIRVSQEQLHSAVVIEDQNNIFCKHYNLSFFGQHSCTNISGRKFTQKEPRKHFVLIRTLV